MSEEVEIETKELQETIEELQEERRERKEEERQTAWTRYVALTTAILAVFAAIAALQSGSLVNEAMMSQLRASDTWNEYQAARQKDHIYAIQSYALLDRGVPPPPKAEPAEGSEHALRPAAAGKTHHGAKAEPKKESVRVWKAATAEERLAQYISQADREAGKEKELQEKAQELEREAARLMERHHLYAYSVALIQVAIALSAVAALTRMRWIWVFSLVVGCVGLVLFALGMAAR